MKFPKNVWDQLRNKTCDDLIRALERDGWFHDATQGKQRVYRKVDESVPRRVSIHYHPKKTYGANLLKALLEDVGWSIDDMRRLKLIK